MGNITNPLRTPEFEKPKRRSILVLGLRDHTGKKTIWRHLQNDTIFGNEFTDITNPNLRIVDFCSGAMTLKPNTFLNEINDNNIQFSLYCVGCNGAIDNWYKNTFWYCMGVIYIVDSTDTKGLLEHETGMNNWSKTIVYQFETNLRNNLLVNVPILVFCNKQDLKKALSVDEIKKRFGVYETKITYNNFVEKTNVRKYLELDDIIKVVYDFLPGYPEGSVKKMRNEVKCPIRFQGCSGLTKQGLKEGLEWLFKEAQNYLKNNEN